MQPPRTIRLARFAVAAAVLLSVPLAGRVAQADGAAEKGRDLATRYCSRCHVVSRENRFSGISSTPSFMMLVDALPDWQERFQTFYARRPHPVHVRIRGIPPMNDLPPNATPFEMESEEVEDILAFVRTLRGN